MRDCMDVGHLSVTKMWSDKNVVIELWFQSIMKFVRIFAGVYCRDVTNRSWAAKLGYYSHYASSSLRYLWDVWPFVICIIMKALNGFLIIQKRDDLGRYNVWKLHRPRMLHGLLADNVNTTLASLLYSCTTEVVFSEGHDRWASWERRA